MRALVPLLLATLLACPAWANPLGGALRITAESAARSADEAATSTATALEKLLHHGDDALDGAGVTLGKQLPEPAISSSDAVDSLGKLGIPVSDDLLKQVDALDDAGRAALVSVVGQSYRVVRDGVRGGLGLDEVIGVFERAGPNVLVSLRAMSTPGGVADGLRGFQQYGDRFAGFARKGDEPAVRELAKHFDELGKLDDAHLDDLLANPAKYFYPDGKPKDAFTRLVRDLGNTDLSATKGVTAPHPHPAPEQPPGTTHRWLPLVASGGVVTFILTPDSWIDLIEPIVGEWLANGLRSVKWFLWWSMVGLALWWILPLLWPLLLLSGWGALKLLARTPGFLGGFCAKLLKGVPGPSGIDPAMYGRRRRNLLRIGLLGSRRAGKSTFIVMLTKYLGRRVKGATLTPHTDDDTKVLEQMAAEISACQPTTEDKTLSLNLAWPFKRSGNTGQSGEIYQLELTDFPGEWAGREATSDQRKRLIAHLRDVDGLLVVIDPTDLEVKEGRGRLKQQETAIDDMFRGADLGLGHGFKRAMAIVITKRDAISTEKLRELAVRHEIPQNDLFDQMCLLVKTQSLSTEEAQNLGRWLLNLMFPGKLEGWETLLGVGETCAEQSRVGQYLRHCSTPKIAVFALSQLGFDLGGRVVAHRQKVREWEESGEQGPKPTVHLELDKANWRELDLHHAFGWMFDHIPAGWLHQALAARGLRRRWYLRSARRRFRGTPAVQNYRLVSRNRWVAAFAGVVLLGLITQPVANHLQLRDDQADVEEFFRRALDSSSQPGDLRAELARVRELPTRPYVEELNTFEKLLNARQRLWADSGLVLGDADQTDAKRIEAAQDWLRTYRKLKLPVMEPGWPPHLETFRQNTTAPLPTVLEQFIKVVGSSVKGKLEQRKYDKAEDLVDECLGVLGDLAPSDEKDRAARKLELLRLKVRKKTVDARYDDLIGETNGLLEQDPPEYLKAIGRIHSFGLDRDLQSYAGPRLTDLRTRTIGQFWKYTKDEVKVAIRGDDVTRMGQLLVAFDQVPDPNPNRKEFEQFRRDVPDMRVRTKLELARSDRQDGKPEQAWGRLASMRMVLPEALSETRALWYRAAMEVKRELGLWGDAVAILSHDEVKAEPWARELVTEVCRNWASDLAKRVPRSVSAGRTDEARKEIGRFLTSASSCPRDVRAEMTRLMDKEVRPGEFKIKVEQAEQLTGENREGALEILNKLQVEVPDITSTKLLEQWRDLKVELLQRLGRHPEAIDFLDSVQEDRQLAEKLPAAPGKIEEIWLRYANDLQRRFDEHMKADQREAWLLLWTHGRNPVDSAFRTSMGDFTAKKIGERKSELTAELKEVVSGDPDEGAYDDALRTIDIVREEFGPWMSAERMGLRNYLENLKKGVYKASLEASIKKINERIGGHDPDQVHRDIKALLNTRDIPDDLLKKIEVAHGKNLVAWERKTYADLREAQNNRQYGKLRELVNKYMDDDVLYVEHRLAARLESVKKLKNWLDRFERTETYSVRAIRVKGFPDYSIYSDFDPAFRIRFKGGYAVDEVHAQQDNVVGTVDVTRFTTNQSFQWKKGSHIEIVVWQDEVENKDGLIGKIELSDPYALPMIAEEYMRIDTQDYDYPELEDIEIGLTIDHLAPMQELPEPRN